MEDNTFIDDAPSTMEPRLVTIKDREFTVKTDGVYGLWSITPRKGAVPKALSGQYTSLERAKQDIEVYVNANHSA